MRRWAGGRQTRGAERRACGVASRRSHGLPRERRHAHPDVEAGGMRGGGRRDRGAVPGGGLPGLLPGGGRGMVLVLDLAARTRAALGWWMLGILGMAAYAVSAYEWISGLEEISRLYQQSPPALRKLFGDVDLGTLNGWVQVEIVSYLPLLLAISAGIFAAGSISREVEEGTVDFLLGLPIGR